MVKINVLTKIPESPIWIQLEKTCWIILFSMPLFLLLWAKILR